MVKLDFFHGKSFPWYVTIQSQIDFQPKVFVHASMTHTFDREIYLSLNSYILSKNIAADNLDFTYGRC